MTDLFVQGVLAHLVADWFLQNEWQATRKVDLRHPAAWVHAGCHLATLLLLAFPWPWAVGLAVVHALVDTRVPLRVWRRWLRQTTEGDVGLHVAFWQDQACHVLCIAVAAHLAGG